MKNLNQIAQENGFKHIKITATELEDGIGAVVGDNYVKNAVWYNTRQMIEEIGLPAYEIKSAALDLNKKEAEQVMMNYIKENAKVYYRIDDFRQMSNGQTKTAFIYA